MGSGVSVAPDGVTQMQLDEAVARVLSHTYDRVLVRAHYAKVLSGKEVDAKLTFAVAAEPGALSVLPEVLSGVEKPPSNASFYATKTSDNPTWNQEELLLFQRNQPEGSLVDTPSREAPISGRVLEVRLENVKHLKERLLDSVHSAAEHTQRFMLRNIERFMTDMDHKSSPLVDAAAEDIDDATPSSIEVINDMHAVPLPAPSQGWVHHKLEGERATVYISIKTSYAEECISTAAQLAAMEAQMTEVKLESLSHGNSALLRHLQRPGNARAVLWVPGFNDSFHNHVFSEALLDAGYDVWILDLRRSGACRRAFPGQTKPLDYHHASDLREYFEEIERSVELMKARSPPYRDIVGYAHSTGAIVMLDYALEFTDTQFSGFIFNSPFLDWGYAGGQLISPSNKALPEKTVVSALNIGQLRKHSLYNFSTDTQALYSLRVADDWMESCERMHKTIEQRQCSHPITRKPFLILASRNEKCMSSGPLMEYSKRIGPARTVVQMSFASHDCVSSRDRDKVEEAISYVTTWLKGNVESGSMPITFETNARPSAAET